MDMAIDLSAGFGSRSWGFLLIGALTIPSVAIPDDAGAVTLAAYDAFSETLFEMTGLTAPDGTPVGADAISSGAESAGEGDVNRLLLVQDTNGDDVSSAGVAEVGDTGGRLLDDAYRVLMNSTTFAIQTFLTFENVSQDPLYAAFRLERVASAEAFSTVSTADVYAFAFNPPVDAYFQNAAGEYFEGDERFSPETIATLAANLSISAFSNGETSVSESLLREFEILLNPGDIFHVEYQYMPAGGELINAPAPVPLPAGAPLLLAALGGLAFPRVRRLLAR